MLLCVEILRTEGWRWFDMNTRSWGFKEMIPLISLINGGFFLNEEISIIADVDVLEVLDTLSASQVSEISLESEQRAHDDSSSSEDLQKKDDVTIEVNGFQVLDSQVIN